MRDDTPVVLRGTITRSLGDEKYMFADDTDSVIIEIDHHRWAGLSISPEDTVEITGEVERDFRRVEIDVSKITKVSGGSASGGFNSGAGSAAQ
jgi:uncharacterized protein (TIGR00156 family)